MRKIRKGDTVIVIAGRDKGKRGDVARVVDAEHVIVSGVNQVKKHQRPNPMKGEQGGIVTKEMPIHISNVAIWPRSMASSRRPCSSVPTESAAIWPSGRPTPRSPIPESAHRARATSRGSVLASSGSSAGTAGGPARSSAASSTVSIILYRSPLG